MAFATPWPCCGPQINVRRINRSRVPCRSSSCSSSRVDIRPEPTAARVRRQPERLARRTAHGARCSSPLEGCSRSNRPGPSTRSSASVVCFGGISQHVPTLLPDDREVTAIGCLDLVQTTPSPCPWKTELTRKTGHPIADVARVKPSTGCGTYGFSNDSISAARAGSRTARRANPRDPAMGVATGRRRSPAGMGQGVLVVKPHDPSSTKRFIVGGRGVRSVFETELAAAEKAAFELPAESVKRTLEETVLERRSRRDRD